MRAVPGRAVICANGGCRKLVQPEDQVKVGRFVYCPEHGKEKQEKQNKGIIYLTSLRKERT